VLIPEVIDAEAFRAKNPCVSSVRVQCVAAHHTTPEQAGTVFARVKPKHAVYSYNDW